MSKDLIHLTGEYWGVKVPKGAIAWRVDISGYLLFELPEPGINGEFYYDDWKPGQWEIVALAKDITQAEWKKIVEPKLFNAIAAAGFMLAAHGLGFSTTLIIKKIA